VGQKKRGGAEILWKTQEEREGSTTGGGKSLSIKRLQFARGENELTKLTWEGNSTHRYERI